MIQGLQNSNRTEMPRTNISRSYCVTEKGPTCGGVVSRQDGLSIVKLITIKYCYQLPCSSDFGKLQLCKYYGHQGPVGCIDGVTIAADLDLRTVSQRCRRVFISVDGGYVVCVQSDLIAVAIDSNNAVAVDTVVITQDFEGATILRGDS